MNLRRFSPIWKVSKEDLLRFVSESSSFKDILMKCGVCNKGDNSRTLKKRLIEEGIDFSHIYLNCFKYRGSEKKSDEEVFVESSHYSRTLLKKRILNQALLPNICSVCGMSPEWNSKPLVLILDHINGISNDNRIENLRFVCPNCNSQLDTHCGKHNKKAYTVKKKELDEFGNVVEIEKEVIPVTGKYVCKFCGKIISRNKSMSCRNCFFSNVDKRKKRPSLEILLEKLKELGNNFVQTGIFFNVTDNAVRKWLLYYGFDPKSFSKG